MSKIKNKVNFEVTKTVATILARQFYSGWIKKERCKYSWKEYKNRSLIHWMSAASGVISLIKE